MSSDAIYYVYAYLDPDTREPFYIGKGKNGRALAHLKEARDERITTKDYYNPIKLSKIRKILEQGMEPIIHYAYEGMTEEDALELEMFLIQEIGRIVLNEGPLTNLTDGGEGFSGLLRDSTIYHLVHIETGEERHVTQHEMYSELGLSSSGASYLVSGKIQFSKGWRLAENDITIDTYTGQKHKFVNAITGKEIIGTVTQLAKYIQCSETLTCAVVRGRKPHAKWWFYNEIPEDRKKEIDEKFTPRYFTHKDGETVFMCSVDLAKEHNLVIGKVNEVMRGTRRHTKGWFLGEEVPKDIKGFKIGGGDPTAFTFVNVENGETFTGTRVEFSSYTGIDQKIVWSIVSQGSTRRNWKLCE